MRKMGRVVLVLSPAGRSLQTLRCTAPEPPRPWKPLKRYEYPIHVQSLEALSNPSRWIAKLSVSPVSCIFSLSGGVLSPVGSAAVKAAAKAANAHQFIEVSVQQ